MSKIFNDFVYVTVNRCTMYNVYVFTCTFDRNFISITKYIQSISSCELIMQWPSNIRTSKFLLLVLICTDGYAKEMLYVHTLTRASYHAISEFNIYNTNISHRIYHSFPWKIVRPKSKLHIYNVYRCFILK